MASLFRVYIKQIKYKYENKNKMEKVSCERKINKEK